MKNSNELPIFCLPINLRGWWYFDPEGVSDIVSLTQPINKRGAPASRQLQTTSSGFITFDNRNQVY